MTLKMIYYRKHWLETTLLVKNIQKKRRNTYINDPNYLFKDVHPSNSLLRINKKYLTANYVIISQVNHLLPGLSDEDADHM